MTSPDLITVSLVQRGDDVDIVFVTADSSLAAETQTTRFLDTLTFNLSGVSGLNSILGLTQDFGVTFAQGNQAEIMT